MDIEKLEASVLRAEECQFVGTAHDSAFYVVRRERRESDALERRHYPEGHRFYYWAPIRVWWQPESAKYRGELRLQSCNGERYEGRLRAIEVAKAHMQPREEQPQGHV